MSTLGVTEKRTGTHGLESTRHILNSLHGHLVTRSPHHSQRVTLTKIPRSQLVTSIKSTRHTVLSSHGQLITLHTYKFKKNCKNF